MKMPSKMDIINLTKQTFSKEFLRMSPKLTEVSEILWFMFKAGGTVPVDIISARFPNFPRDLAVLEDAGIIEIRNEKIVLFTEKFEEGLLSKDLTKIDVQDINSILLNRYWNKLSRRFGLEGLENSLAIVLSSVILSAKPNQPALLSRVLRTCDSFFGETGKVLKSVVGDPELILDHYLNRSLELVKPVGNIGVALTEKSEKLISKNQFLQEIYTGKTKIREKLAAEMPLPEEAKIMLTEAVPKEEIKPIVPKKKAVKVKAKKKK